MDKKNSLNKLTIILLIFEFTLKMAIIDSTFIQMLDWLGTMTFPIPPPGPLAAKNQFHGGNDFSEGIDSEASMPDFDFFKY